MEITYLGHSSFKLKTKSGLMIIIDPFSPEFVGIPFPKDVADIVISSHDHEDHNNFSAITGPVKRAETFVIKAEGEYEIGGVEIAAMKTSHDKTDGSERGKNLVTVIRDGELVVCHLGDIGQKLSDSMIEKIGSVGVLMIPVGGNFTIDSEEAMDLINDIQPSLVIPMHYKVPGMKDGFDSLAPLQSFMDKNKYPMAGEAAHKLKVEESSLPDDTQVAIMNG